MSRHFKYLQRFLHAKERGSAPLHPAGDVGTALRRVLHEAPAEILERARILALQLNTILRVAQAFQHDSQAALFVHARPRLEAIKEGGLVARISAAADADHGERQRHPRISE